MWVAGRSKQLTCKPVQSHCNVWNNHHIQISSQRREEPAGVSTGGQSSMSREVTLCTQLTLIHVLVVYIHRQSVRTAIGVIVPGPDLAVWLSTKMQNNAIKLRIILLWHMVRLALCHLGIVKNHWFKAPPSKHTTWTKSNTPSMMTSRWMLGLIEC